jgi:hypothetical protein
MKYILLIATLLCACSGPLMRELAHDAAIAEQAIEHEAECPGCAHQMSMPEKPANSIKNQRQYPDRRPNRVPKRDRFSHGI